MCTIQGILVNYIGTHALQWHTPIAYQIGFIKDGTYKQLL